SWRTSCKNLNGLTFAIVSIPTVAILAVSIPDVASGFPRLKLPLRGNPHKSALAQSLPDETARGLVCGVPSPRKSENRAAGDNVSYCLPKAKSSRRPKCAFNHNPSPAGPAPLCREGWPSLPAQVRRSVWSSEVQKVDKAALANP